MRAFQNSIMKALDIDKKAQWVVGNIDFGLLSPKEIMFGKMTKKLFEIICGYFSRKSFMNKKIEKLRL